MTQPPSPARQRLASILRRLREDAGMSTYQFAKALGWSQSKVTRVENGRTIPGEDDVAAWAQAAKTDAAAMSDLAALAVAAGTEVRSWRASHRKGLAARQREQASMDAAATEILHFQPSVIPGLLQTPDYARRVLAFGDVTEAGDIEEAAAERAKRQAILRDPARRFDYVLTEGALRWHPGEPGLMEEQLGRLLAAAALPNVSVGIIPFAAEPRAVYFNGFAIFRRPDAPVVLIEHYTGENFLAAQDDVDVYERVFAALRDSALTGDEAADFARSVILG